MSRNVALILLVLLMRKSLIPPRSGRHSAAPQPSSISRRALRPRRLLSSCTAAMVSARIIASGRNVSRHGDTLRARSTASVRAGLPKYAIEAFWSTGGAGAGCLRWCGVSACGTGNPGMASWRRRFLTWRLGGAESRARGSRPPSGRAGATIAYYPGCDPRDPPASWRRKNSDLNRAGRGGLYKFSVHHLCAPIAPAWAW
jgi:hypothetical protein